MNRKYRSIIYHSKTVKILREKLRVLTIEDLNNLLQYIWDERDKPINIYMTTTDEADAVRAIRKDQFLYLTDNIISYVLFEKLGV